MGMKDTGWQAARKLHCVYAVRSSSGAPLAVENSV